MGFPEFVSSLCFKAIRTKAAEARKVALAAVYRLLLLQDDPGLAFCVNLLSLKMQRVSGGRVLVSDCVCLDMVELNLGGLFDDGAPHG